MWLATDYKLCMDCSGARVLANGAPVECHLPSPAFTTTPFVRLALEGLPDIADVGGVQGTASPSRFEEVADFNRCLSPPRLLNHPIQLFVVQVWGHCGRRWSVEKGSPTNWRASGAGLEQKRFVDECDT
jgi:hypothetical protein